MYPLNEPIEEVAYFGSDLLPSILRMCLTTTFTVVTMFVLSPVLTLAILPLVPLFLIARQHFRMKLSAESDDVSALSGRGAETPFSPGAAPGRAVVWEESKKCVPQENCSMRLDSAVSHGRGV